MVNDTNKDKQSASNPAQDNMAVFKQLIETNPMMKGAFDAAKKRGAEEFNLAADTQGLESTNTNLLQRLMSGFAQGAAWGMAPEMMKNKAKALEQTQLGKEVYGFDPSTGAIKKAGTVPIGADVRNVKGELGLGDLPSDQAIGAYQLARDIGGVRGAQNVLPAIITGLKEGKNIDSLRDELRFMQQSSEFSPVRDAAQQLTIGMGDNQSQRTFDYLDDLMAKGEPEKVKSYVKRMAIKNASVDQQKQVMGQERTVDFLGEIQDDLNKYESMGGSTGLFEGTMENLMAKVGRVKEPELRKVATKIASAMMKYRRSMTGVAFGQMETEEYKKMFPNINKVGAFNKSVIDALKESFTGDINKFYSLSMGEDNYKAIFKDKIKEQKSNNNSNKPMTIGRFKVEVS